MKKIIIITLLLLILVVGGGLAYVATNAGSLVKSFKPQIEQAASDTLGSPVALGNIDVSVFPKTRLIIDSFTLGKGKEQFKLQNLTFRANLLALVSGKVDIREVSLDQPNITIIQGTEGVRIAGLPKPKKGKKKRKKKQKPAVSESGETAQGVSLPEAISLNLETFEISDAAITVINEAQQKLIGLSKINLNSTVSFEKNVLTLPAFSFSAILNEKEPLEASGSNITFKLQNSNLSIPDLGANAFGGRYDSSLALSGQQELQTKATLAGVLFEKVIEGFKPDAPSPITGTLESFTYDLTGSLKGQPAKNITGPITVALKDGELRDTNLGGSVLKEVLSLPFFTQTELAEEEQEAIDADTTPLKTLTGTFNLAGGAMTTDNFAASSALFDMVGKGRMTVDGAIDFTTSFIFSPILSANLTSKVKELKSLLNQDERLVVPVAIKGKASNIIVVPDLKELSKMGAAKVVEKGAQKLLDKAFGKNEDGSSKANIDVGGLGNAFGF